jgi:serine/threonine protein kinase
MRHHLAIPLLAAFQDTTSFYMLMPLAEYGSLGDYLSFMKERTADGSCLDEEEISFWGRQMSEAVQWLHDCGFVHRSV